MKTLDVRIKEMQAEADECRRKIAEGERSKRKLASITEQLQRAAAILRGDTLADKPKSRHGFVGGRRAKPIQEGSSVWWTAKVLYRAQQPMHIDRILERVKSQAGLTFKKATVVSNLSRYVKHGDTFTRPAPNVYALIDFSQEIGADSMFKDEDPFILNLPKHGKRQIELEENPV